MEQVGARHTCKQTQVLRAMPLLDSLPVNDAG